MEVWIGIDKMIYIKDCRGLTDIEDNSVELVVTSPPYWCIKDYGFDEQVGFGQEYWQYIEDLAEILFVDCYRVLKPGCKLCVNIGDMFLSAKDFGKHSIAPIAANLISMRREFDFMGNIIWNKIPNCNPSGGGQWMGSTYYPRDGAITFEYEYVMLFKKVGWCGPPSEEAKEKSRLTKEERSDWFRSMWTDVHPASQKKGHPAVFPEELPRRLIKMYSYWGETVLDPFMGTGTTARVAEELGRKWIGYELNKEWVNV